MKTIYIEEGEKITEGRPIDWHWTPATGRMLYIPGVYVFTIKSDANGKLCATHNDGRDGADALARGAIRRVSEAFNSMDLSNVELPPLILPDQKPQPKMSHDERWNAVMARAGK
jgi:hypothetical protein